jgi:glycosyltransferase involved in cell wall biosynthesis
MKDASLTKEDWKRKDGTSMDVSRVGYGTGLMAEILRQLAKEDARVKVKRVEVLPDGWLGKCHACHVGASAATGDWILFTDADCWLRPDMLGLLLVRAGKRTRAFLGVNDVECHWGTTVGSMVKVMEKNYFAMLDFRLGLALAGSVAAILVFAVLVLGLISGTAAGLAAGLSPLTMVLPASILARRVGWSWPCAIYVPFMMPVFLYALLNLCS